MAKAFIGVGSNINPEKNVREALRLLSLATRVMAVSTFYRTQPIERPEQPMFYNGIVEVETDLAAEDLKTSVLRVIEKSLGRRRSDDMYAARTIYLDIIAYDDTYTRDDEITGRPFVALPLYELAPDLRLAYSGEPLSEIAATFAENDMLPLTEFTEHLRKGVLDGP
jgi:2-amino-4-hydroxy-6-hydroxymethyldihydropteridine diphosphokinase